MQQNNKTMSKRFDEKFGFIFQDYDFEDGSVKLAEFKDEVRSFIQKELSDQAKEIMEKADGMMFIDSNQAGQFALHSDGYNQAIEEIKDLLTTYINNETNE